MACKFERCCKIKNKILSFLVGGLMGLSVYLGVRLCVYRKSVQ